MKKLIVLLCCVVLLCGCQQGKMAVSGFGSTDGDAAFTAGRVVSETAEVGVAGVAFAVEDDHATYAMGPYAAYLVPLPADIADDWQPFAGGAMLVELEEGGLIPKLVGGVVYKPYDTLSPVYMAEKAWPGGEINSPDITARGDDVYHYLGLRYRF
jgi:hypothetical protein